MWSDSCRRAVNDTIQTEEDVEKYMGLTVLASVPLREGEAEENKNEQTLSRSHMHNKDDKKKESREIVNE